MPREFSQEPGQVVVHNVEEFERKFYPEECRRRRFADEWSGQGGQRNRIERRTLESVSVEVPRP